MIRGAAFFLLAGIAFVLTWGLVSCPAVEQHTPAWRAR